MNLPLLLAEGFQYRKSYCMFSPFPALHFHRQSCSCQTIFDMEIDVRYWKRFHLFLDKYNLKKKFHVKMKSWQTNFCKKFHYRHLVIIKFHVSFLSVKDFNATNKTNPLISYSLMKIKN